MIHPTQAHHLEVGYNDVCVSVYECVYECVRVEVCVCIHVCVFMCVA